MAKPDTEMSENSKYFSSIYAPEPLRNLLPKVKQKARMAVSRSRLRSNGENIPPIDPNIQIQDPPLSASTTTYKKSLSKLKIGLLKEGIRESSVQEKVPDAADPPVKVFVRIKPAKGLAIGDISVGKVSKDSLSVAERKYTFDAVFDADSTQEDLYQRACAPLIKDALSGYNISVLAYGQTGSGKTYTMWGPPSAMIEGQASTGLEGIVPRIFQDLFVEIQKERENPNGKQINYHCRCSFLEVYDGKIGDLLDPIQRDLEIKDDSRNSFYVENLREEYVTSYEDVTQILIKGLSNRKIGATSMNSKSSRSHIMFTCVIDSWCKEASSNCFGTSKTSRISLVDLAGFDRNLLDDASRRQHVKEGKYVKKSLSQLGFLVNNLAEGSQSGNSKEVDPCRSSCLTHLLRESFGGNSKLAIICTIFPDYKNTSGTASTLRFGLRARLMKNEPVMNEITEDDVNHLSDQIRLLKEELMRANSSTCNSLPSNDGYFTGKNKRASLNKLRLSLNRSLSSHCIDKDCEESLAISEDDVKNLKLHIDNMHHSQEDSWKEDSDYGENTLLYSAEGCQIESHCELYLSCSEDSEEEETHSNEIQPVHDSDEIHESVNECHQSAVLKDPVLSESPKIRNSQRKCVDSPNNVQSGDEEAKSLTDQNFMYQSHQLENNRSSLKSSRKFTGPTESLAASLRKGLQIIEYHQNSSRARSSVSFSFEHLAPKPCPSDAVKADIQVQTSAQEGRSSDQLSALSFCMKCQGKDSNVDESGLQDMAKDLALAVLREKELSRICEDRSSQIENLNKQLEQLKFLYSQNSFCRGSSNFSNTKNQLQPIHEDEPYKCQPADNEKKFLTLNSVENHHEPESTLDKCEIEEVQFPTEEKESLLREIQILRNKLQFYTDAPTRTSTDKVISSLLSQSMQLRKSYTIVQNTSPEELEKERQKWLEMESEWISLTDELRIEIEGTRHIAEQLKNELTLEKKCTEELDDVLKRSVIGQARMIEHYAELQEKYNDLLVKHRSIMEGVAEVKRAACKAVAKGGRDSRFAKAITAELCAARAERERERVLLKKENQSLKIQLKDIAESVHAAGEVLARLREAEEAASQAEGKYTLTQEENEKLKKQIEKLKRKHNMEMITMKQYLAESRLPEAALRPLVYREDLDVVHDTLGDEDQAWKAEFGAIYQEHF